jgi:signal transduction histidine kinase
MKTYFSILTLLMLPAVILAQMSKPDSLEHALAAARTDSARYILLEQLRDYYTEGNFQKANYYTARALALARANHKIINEASDLDITGYNLLRSQKYPQAFQLIQQAIDLAGDPGNEGQGWRIDQSLLISHQTRLSVLGMSHLDMGHLMGRTGNIGRQIIEYRTCIQLAGQSKDIKLFGLAVMSLGRVYLKLNRVDSALILGRKAEKVFNKVPEKIYLGFTYGVFGDIYSRKGDKPLALHYYHNGLIIDQKQNNLYSANVCYIALTEYYLQMQQADSSIYYAKGMFKNLHKMGSQDLGDAYEYIYKSYLLQHRGDSAHRYQDLALTAKDSSYKATVKNLTDFQQLSFKQELKLQQLEKEKAAEKTRFGIYVLCAIISVLLLLALIFYRNNLQKRKANKVLTEQKEEIEAQRDELTATLQQLKAAQTQLIQSEKMASLGELTAGIAHEIQNPLNFVNNFSEVSVELLSELKEEAGAGHTEDVIAIADDLTGNLEKIRHHGKRADAIVKGMLEHSRAGSGQKEPTDLNKLADEYLRLAYHGLRAKDKSFNAELIMKFDKALPMVNMIPQDIGRVTLNLFNNAFYAVQQKAKTAPDYKPVVEVATAVQGGNVIVSVKDNGSGIPQNIKDKIMQPFFTTKPTGEGTGLGLSLSYDIVVKGHGGNITIDTKEGIFTEFTISLPLSIK